MCGNINAVMLYIKFLSNKSLTCTFVIRVIRVTFYCYPACVYLQLQGSLMVGSLFQMFVGFSGLIGLFMCFIGPLTIAPTISLIGLSLFDSAGTSAGYHWGVAVMWVLLSESVFLGVGIISASTMTTTTTTTTAKSL